jgi:hypothetical protein
MKKCLEERGKSFLLRPLFGERQTGPFAAQ